MRDVTGAQRGTGITDRISLEIGNYKTPPIESVSVRLDELLTATKGSSDSGVEIILGVDVLSLNNAIIDYAGHTVYFHR